MGPGRVEWLDTGVGSAGDAGRHWPMVAVVEGVAHWDRSGSSLRNLTFGARKKGVSFLTPLFLVRLFSLADAMMRFKMMMSSGAVIPRTLDFDWRNAHGVGDQFRVRSRGLVELRVLVDGERTGASE